MGENLNTDRTSARTTNRMSALNCVAQIRHHRVHTYSGSQNDRYLPDVTAATLTVVRQEPRADIECYDALRDRKMRHAS